jgi:hypothetical protein
LPLPVVAKFACQFVDQFRQPACGSSSLLFSPGRAVLFAFCIDAFLRLFLSGAIFPSAESPGLQKPSISMFGRPVKLPKLGTPGGAGLGGIAKQSCLSYMTVRTQADRMKSSAKRKQEQRLRNPPQTAYATLAGWALGLLIEAHAVRECEEHGHMRDRSDPHAGEHARELARAEPFHGTSPEQAVAALDEVMRSIGDTCPACE